MFLTIQSPEVRHRCSDEERARCEGRWSEAPKRSLLLVLASGALSRSHVSVCHVLLCLTNLPKTRVWNRGRHHFCLRRLHLSGCRPMCLQTQSFEVWGQGCCRFSDVFKVSDFVLNLSRFGIDTVKILPPHYPQMYSTCSLL